MIGIVAIGIVSVALLPRLWRGEVLRSDYDRPPGWWVWGTAVWRGLLRALPWVWMNAPILAIIAVVSWGISSPEPIENGLHVPLWYVVLAFAWIATFFPVCGEASSPSSTQILGSSPVPIQAWCASRMGEEKRRSEVRGPEAHVGG